jgi:uncharacterized membrane protein YfcA
VTLAWIAGAVVIAVSCFVMGLAGFGIALVALAFLPFLMPAATAIVLMTLYALVFAVVILVPLRREVTVGVRELLAGTLLGTPVGVWTLATLSASTLHRLIGLMLVVAVLLEWLGRYPETLRGPWWGLGAGAAAGVVGGAVGTPGPPVILYAAAQRWSPRTMKANLQVFFAVNQAAILAGYWWAGLLTADVLRLALTFAVPALAGVAAGVMLFNRIDAARFRRVVFALLFVSGVVLLVRG